VVAYHLYLDRPEIYDTMGYVHEINSLYCSGMLADSRGHNKKARSFVLERMGTSRGE
jgi:hypothetical protein